MRPGPPVAIIMVSPRNARSSSERLSIAHDAAAIARLIEDEAGHLPVLELADEARDLVAAHLLVQRVQQLLTGGGAGERGAMMLGAAEAAEIQQALGRAIEHHAHAIEQVDDAGRGLAHPLDRRLIGEEVAAVDACRRNESSASRPRLWC